jgi:MFS family permease
VTPLAYLRSLHPHQGRALTILQTGGFVSAFGNGLVLPFLFLYLTDVRDIDKATAGFVVATNALVSVAVGPLAGAIGERLGAKRTLVGGCTSPGRPSSSRSSREPGTAPSGRRSRR